MPAFQYEAMKMSDRSRITGLISALSEREARELLREQDLIPTKLLVVQESDAKGSRGKQNFIMAAIQGFMGVGANEKIAFTRNIGMMIRAGIPLTEALMFFEQYSKNPKFRAVISQVRRDILSGFSFSAALGKHKTIFNQVYVNVTKAGERSGELDQTMERLTEMMTKAEKLKMRVIAAAVYPTIIMVIVFIVMIIMFVLVIPTFIDIYDKIGAKLPLITIIMAKISDFLRLQWYIAFPLMAMSIFGFIKYIKSPSGKVVKDRFILKVPMIGELVKFIENSNFVSTLFVSFGSGLPIVDALYLATQTIQHTQIREAYSKVNVQIQTGQRLATALANTGYVPDIVLLMISTGEESGDMERMLESSFEYLDDEISHRIDMLMTAMEPILLGFVGIIVGTIALSIYLPLFSMYDFIGQ